MKLYTLPLLAIVAGGLIGCGDDDYYRPAHVVEVDEGAPVVYDTYYDRGYYDGPYYTWRDHEGHEYRERREFHERRMYERGHREGYHGESSHGEHHEH